MHTAAIIIMPVTVSYTHLDVYKRQIINNMNSFICSILADKVFISRIVPYPVSYTHLDVYKRQMYLMAVTSVDMYSNIAVSAMKQLICDMIRTLPIITAGILITGDDVDRKLVGNILRPFISVDIFVKFYKIIQKLDGRFHAVERILCMVGYHPWITGNPVVRACRIIVTVHNSFKNGAHYCHTVRLSLIHI